MPLTSPLKPFDIQAIIFPNLNTFITLGYFIILCRCKLRILLSDNIFRPVVDINIFSLFTLPNNAKLLSGICVFLYFFVTFFFNEYCTMRTTITIHAVQLLRPQRRDLVYSVWHLNICLILWISKVGGLIYPIDAASFIATSWISWFNGIDGSNSLAVCAVWLCVCTSSPRVFAVYFLAFSLLILYIKAKRPASMLILRCLTFER